MGFTTNNNQRPRLITFCGLPGSGKSTIAKALEQTTGALRLNTDEWVAVLGVDFWDDAFRAKLQVRLYEHGITVLQRGQSILWKMDFGGEMNVTAIERWHTSSVRR